MGKYDELQAPILFVCKEEPGSMANRGGFWGGGEKSTNRHDIICPGSILVPVQVLFLNLFFFFVFLFVFETCPNDPSGRKYGQYL